MAKRFADSEEDISKAAVDAARKAISDQMKQWGVDENRHIVFWKHMVNNALTAVMIIQGIDNQSRLKKYITSESSTHFMNSELADQIGKVYQQYYSVPEDMERLLRPTLENIGFQNSSDMESALRPRLHEIAAKAALEVLEKSSNPASRSR